MNMSIDETVNSGLRMVWPLTIADVMTRDVITLIPNHSFSDALSLMAKHSFRHFLVVDRGTLVGVVSDRDILRVLARTTDWETTLVSDFMRRDLVTGRPDTPISVAVENMVSKRVNCLPVIDSDNNLQGIVTSTDLLKMLGSVQELLENETKVVSMLLR